MLIYIELSFGLTQLGSWNGLGSLVITTVGLGEDSGCRSRYYVRYYPGLLYRGSEKGVLYCNVVRCIKIDTAQSFVMWKYGRSQYIQLCCPQE